MDFEGCVPSGRASKAKIRLTTARESFGAKRPPGANHRDANGAPQDDGDFKTKKGDLKVAPT